MTDKELKQLQKETESTIYYTAGVNPTVLNKEEDSEVE